MGSPNEQDIAINPDDVRNGARILRQTMSGHESDFDQQYQRLLHAIDKLPPFLKELYRAAAQTWYHHIKSYHFESYSQLADTLDVIASNFDDANNSATMS